MTPEVPHTSDGKFFLCVRSPHFHGKGASGTPSDWEQEMRRAGLGQSREMKVGGVGTTTQIPQGECKEGRRGTCAHLQYSHEGRRESRGSSTPVRCHPAQYVTSSLS